MSEADELSEQSIRAAMAPAAAARLRRVDVFSSIDSTNRWLADQEPPPAGSLDAAIADYQSAGRGRRGRHWEIPPGHGLCLSVTRLLDCPPARLAALTLAVGVTVAEVLEGEGAAAVKLKWPNDLVLYDGKLGGILSEVATGTAGQGPQIVVGIGINIRLPVDFMLSEPPVWGRGPVPLIDAVEPPPARNRLAGRLITALTECFSDYEREGLPRFVNRWRSRDWLLGAEVAVRSEDGEIAGIGAGIADDGALLVDTDNGQHRIIAGDVLRCRRSSALDPKR